MRISDWSSDVCSSDLGQLRDGPGRLGDPRPHHGTGDAGRRTTPGARSGRVLSMLSIRGLSVSYAGVPAVQDVTLDLPTGQVLAVLGPSGCGKSTLLRAVAGLEPVRSGPISFDSRAQAHVPTHKRNTK